MKRIFTTSNLMLLMLLGVLIQNYVLRQDVLDAKRAALNAEYEARKASNYASSAEDFSREAAEYAEEASNRAYNAYLEASNAASNSFGNQCWSCP